MITTWSFYVFQLDLTFHLFVCALAGAGAAVIAMVTIIILKYALLDLEECCRNCCIQPDCDLISSSFTPPLSKVHFLMALAANWGYLKDTSRMQKYEDIKSKEEQELHDIHSTRSKERLNAYT